MALNLPATRYPLSKFSGEKQLVPQPRRNSRKISPEGDTGLQKVLSGEQLTEDSTLPCLFSSGRQSNRVSVLRPTFSGRLLSSEGARLDRGVGEDVYRETEVSWLGEGSW